MDLQKIRQNQFQAICQFSVPAIIAMVLTSMITIADGFFTGNYVGKEGIAAINLGLPIVYLYLGLGLMISVGGSAIASRALGAGETERGNAVFNQTMITTVVLSFLFSGINTITAFYFTSIGKARETATISALRGLVILLICIFTLPILFGMMGVWMVAPVTEVITIPACIWFLIKNDTTKREEKGAEHVTAN